MPRQKNILHDYFGVVESSYWKGEREFHAHAKDAITALNMLHRHLQKTRELDAKRKVLRPKLKPDEYKIVKLFQKYEDYDKKTVRAFFDLPRTGNPSVLPVKKVKTPNMTFGFPEENLIKPKDEPLSGGATPGNVS
jgi:hypothetical protein